MKGAESKKNLMMWRFHFQLVRCWRYKSLYSSQ